MADHRPVSVLEGTDPTDVRRRLRNRELPAELRRLVAEYEGVSGDRDRFLWAWVHALSPSFRLPSVHRTYAEENDLLTTKLTMFVTLLDDLVDNRGDAATFGEATKVHSPNATADLDRPDADAEYLAFARAVWTDVRAHLDDAPRRDEFVDLLLADLDRVIDAIRFAETVNRQPGDVTLSELEAETAYNMAMLAYADVDLMFSPAFDPVDLLPTRRVVRACQEMARIGNWITTWERELREGDFTSGVVVAAVEEGVISAADLAALREGGDRSTRRRIVAAIESAGIEGRLLESWHRKYDRAMELAAEPRSLDMTEYVRGMEDVLRFHLAGRGLK